MKISRYLVEPCRYDRSLESNLPKYQFPSVHVFPEIIHYFHANYDPIMKVVVSLDQKILFTITTDSINEMLQLQTGQDLTPLFTADLLEIFSKLSNSISTQILQNFISEEKHMPKDRPPYMSAFFSDLGKDITIILSFILGSTTNEYVDETIFVGMSIFTPSQPLAIKFNYEKLITDKMHD